MATGSQPSSDVAVVVVFLGSFLAAAGAVAGAVIGGVAELLVFFKSEQEKIAGGKRESESEV